MPRTVPKQRQSSPTPQQEKLRVPKVVSGGGLISTRDRRLLWRLEITMDLNQDCAAVISRVRKNNR
jgi:hypothetical protein